MWSCDQTAECIAERRLAELNAEERQALSEHLEACPACHAQVAEDRALEKVLSEFLKPVTAVANAPRREESDTPTDKATTTARQGPSRSFRRALMRTVKWAAVLLLVVIGTMAATESGRRHLGKLAAIVRETFSVEWESPSGGSGMTISDEPIDREVHMRQLAEIERLKQAGKGKLVGLLETPEWTIYLVDYTLSGGESMRSGGPRITLTEAQAKAMHLDEVQRLRREGKGRLLAQKESPLGLGSFKIAFTLSSGEEVVLDAQYPPGPASDRERIFDQIREQQKGGAGRILELSLNENGMLSGMVQYTLPDGRRVRVSQVFGHLEPGQRIPGGE